MATVRVLKRRVVSHRWRDPGEVIVVGDKQAALMANDPGAFEVLGEVESPNPGDADVPVDVAVLGLAQRTERALRDVGVDYVQQLQALVVQLKAQADPAARTATVLTTIKGIGMASAEEIVTALEGYDGRVSAG